MNVVQRIISKYNLKDPSIYDCKIILKPHYKYFSLPQKPQINGYLLLSSNRFILISNGSFYSKVQYGLDLPLVVTLPFNNNSKPKHSIVKVSDKSIKLLVDYGNNEVSHFRIRCFKSINQDLLKYGAV